MKRNMKSIMILLLILLLTAAGCNKTETPPVAEPAETDNQVVEAFGTVEVKTISGLTVDFPTAVKQVNVQDGELLTAGQVLIVLDMSSINNSIRQQEFEVQKLQNELQTQQLLYDKSQKDLERRKALLDAGALTDTEYEEYEMALIKISSDMKSLEISIAKAEAEKSLIKNQLNSKNYLSGNNIISPFEKGLVSEVNCYEGDSISTPRSLLSIMDMQSMYIEAEIPEEFIGDIKLNAKVIIVPVADSDKKYQGRVTNIYNLAKNRDGETIIPVEISIEDADEFLKPKYNVDVQISTE